MTTWIGQIGDMIPTPCASELSVGNEQRVTFGGGEGTLSPRRVRLHGPGARTWQAQVNSKNFTKRNELVSLARRQALYGGSYRVIPCDAVEHNMLTPRASEELWGWTGLSVGPTTSFPTVSALDANPMMMGRVAAGGTATSPRVPILMREKLFGSAYVSGVGDVRIVVNLANGSTNSTAVTFSHSSAEMKRVGLDRTLPATGVSVQLQVRSTATNPVHFAWPSVAYADNPYVTGEGCDSAYLSMPERTLRTTLRGGLEDFTYQIVEVGQ